MIQGDVLDFMPKHNGDLIFAVHVSKDSCTDKDVSTWKRDSAIKARIWIVVEAIR